MLSGNRWRTDWPRRNRARMSEAETSKAVIGTTRSSVPASRWRAPPRRRWRAQGSARPPQQVQLPRPPMLTRADTGALARWVRRAPRPTRCAISRSRGTARACGRRRGAGADRAVHKEGLTIAWYTRRACRRRAETHAHPELKKATLSPHRVQAGILPVRHTRGPSDPNRTCKLFSSKTI